MLKYTGHPLYDVGVATVTASAGKSDPAQVTTDDFAAIVEYMEREYQRDPLKSFLGVAFTNNAWFNQWAFEKQPGKRADYAARLLRQYVPGEGDSTGETCVFTGEPTARIPFSEGLPAGRAFRQHVPLTTGEGLINFYPSGNTGLPVSGKAAVCIHAFPLGCAKCGGRLLAVHSDDAELMLEFASKFLSDNREKIMAAHHAGSSKIAEGSMPAKTLLVEVLCQVEKRRREAARSRESADRPGDSVSVTAYHLTNSGQSNPLDRRSPPLEIYHLPMEITRFLRGAMSSTYGTQWQTIVQRAWQLDVGMKKKKKKDAGAASEDGDGAGPRRNYLYEDLFALPDNAAAFVRRYFLRIPERRAASDDPRRSYSLRDETSLVSWGIAELFLRGVMGVDRDRVEQIRRLGDRLAQYVSRENDRRFFMAFYSERIYDVFRNALIRANVRQVRSGEPPLIDLDSYIDVFEEGDEVARSDWRLARDLVLIRMIEELHRLGWLGRNADTLPSDKEEE